MGEKSTKIFRPRRVEPSYENAKVWTKKLSDLLDSGDDTNMGCSTYWDSIREIWKNLKEAMNERV